MNTQLLLRIISGLKQRVERCAGRRICTAFLMIALPTNLEEDVPRQGRDRRHRDTQDDD